LGTPLLTIVAVLAGDVLPHRPEHLVEPVERFVVVIAVRVVLDGQSTACDSATGPTQHAEVRWCHSVIFAEDCSHYISLKIAFQEEECASNQFVSYPIPR
jgi:hypothetical protein